MADTIVIRDAWTIDGAPQSLRIEDGMIVAARADIEPAGRTIDAGGRVIHPGLADHHIHLFAAAARLRSVDLSGCLSASDIRSRLGSAPPGPIRAIGYDERCAGLPDRQALDRWVGDRPLRIQDRTGALWLLNSAAVGTLGAGPFPGGVEIASDGTPTGRIRREDRWLRERLGGSAPDLAPLSRALAEWGLTEVTDAGPHNGPDEAALLESAIQRGELLQDLILMGDETLPESRLYRRGPLKLHYDEATLPDPAAVARRVRAARAAGRGVAAHCVTISELLLYLAALDEAGGVVRGDRIEHGGMIPQSLLPDIAQAGLTVVSNPGFVRTRGDRYRATIAVDDQPDLYRLASLERCSIPLLAGSDAPYGFPDPWLAIRAAVDRRTDEGAVLGPGEALSPTAALDLYRSGRTLVPGSPANLVLLEADWAIAAGSPVTLTMIGGRVIFQR
ncbi:amidohydrolase family protein [Novosphingobium tardum]|uniref:Amidohydrolase family protein n=1 Tax=Novosphingobium tardum TaxID=1538021 RepID=A0ABV8RSH8_9SPHN